MSREEVAALARAFAVVNGHDAPDVYAEAVASAWVEPGDVAEARRDETAKREEG